MLGRSYLLANVRPEQLKFKSGTVKIITMEEVRRRLVFTHARLTAGTCIISNDPLLVVKILAELGQYELSIDLALAYGVGVGYSIAVLMKQFNPDNTEGDSNMEVDEEEEDFMKKREREALKKQGDQILEVLVKRLTTTQKAEVVVAMWSQMIDIPQFLEESLIEEIEEPTSSNEVRKIVPNSDRYFRDCYTQLLKVYLSDQNPNIERVVAFLMRQDYRKIVEEVGAGDL